MLLRGAFSPTNDLTEESIAHLDRRRFLQLGTAALAGLAIAPQLALADSNSERCLTIYMPHTGETMRSIYWAPGEGYIKESIQELSHLLRDRHNDKVIDVDPSLIDQLYALKLQLQPRQPIHVLSGYRSPETNARLRRRSRGVAKNSLHMRGMAADIRMPDRDLRQVHKAALALKAGGVGRYRRSNFVHLDSGPVRRWG